ncbi:TolC family protein [Flavihumibacter profundi]|jgi:outer membrane protein|uniref:TolC family protein n=1 Tax=Flavihumibacter profundi TaxID=2716883 RepID=UPI001CC68A50|nr:TolC family protein [Flavihumibacter profundi]MBZ5859549.1 TolC family protein [Flavihumibacter profundi]
MPVRSLYILAFFWLLLPAPELIAQDSTFPRWTLVQCIQYAEQHNIALNNFRLIKQLKEQDQVQAKAAIIPDLYGGASYDFTHYSQASSLSKTTVNTTGSWGLSSKVVLYNGGILKTNIRQSDLDVKIADLNIAQEKNSLYLNIIEAYTNILLSKETINYAKVQLESSQVQNEQAKIQYNAGAIARKQLIQLEAQLANDEFTLTNAQNAERSNKVILKQLLQIPVTDSFDISDKTAEFALQLIPSLNEVLESAMKFRPEIKSSQLNREMAELDLKIAKAGYLPSISVGGKLYTGNQNIVNKNILAQLNDNFYQNIGISASIPIFTKKINATNVARAKISITQSDLNQLNTKTILSQEIEQAYITTNNAYGEYLAAKKQFGYYEEAYKIASEELRLGATNITEFVQQRNLYTQALQAYVQAKYKAMLAYNVLNFYAGKLNN